MGILITTAMAIVASLITAPGSAAADPADTPGVVHLDTPSAWPTVDVDDAPGCVRYDKHAVYLGQPSESTCPARLIGRTTTVQTFNTTSAPELDPELRSPAPRIVQADSEDTLLVTDGTRILARITIDSDDPALAHTIAASATIDGLPVEVDSDMQAPSANSMPDTVASPDGLRSSAGSAFAAAAPTSVADDIEDKAFRGMAFDACTAPSADAMKAWRASSYDAIGIYVGGAARACSQANLTKAWTDQVARYGWKFIPIYVGLQAPKGCCSAQIDTDPPTATTQGRLAADDAIAKMVNLGFGKGNPIYLDMEAWNTKNKTANAAVISYIHGWTEQLHQRGYISALYASSGGGMHVIADRIQTNPDFSGPDAIWYAHWYKQDYATKARRDASISSAHVQARKKFDSEGLLDPRYFTNDLWTKHQRGWQYLGGHTVNHGGHSINIDSSLFDGPAAQVDSAAIDIVQTDLPNINIGASYSTTITAKGQTSAYRYEATAGALPPGMSLSPSGRLTGTVANMGYWSFTVFVTNPAKPGVFGARTYQVFSSFKDVGPKNLFTPAVTWLVNKGITYGYPDGTFRTAAGVTRGAMAAFLYRFTHDGAGPPACTGKGPFADVKPDDEFCGHITWLKTQKMTYGYPDGEFKADNTVTRGAMAAFLYRFTHDGAGPPACTGKGPFADVKPDDEFCGHIKWLKDTGLVEGYAEPNGPPTFRAANTVTRGAMAAMLYRMN